MAASPDVVTEPFAKWTLDCPVHALAFHHQSLFVGTGHNTASEWSVAPGLGSVTKQREFAHRPEVGCVEHHEEVVSMCVVDDWLFTTSWHGRAQQWDLATGKHVRELNIGPEHLSLIHI
eukprot:TRINITY_DN57280_c0_g1_i1.p1 TRINITY_DN57280_c0_g1~~TRINITY_DN57280_c0_g1_i1.p1  ORF type:complete len:119 (+),score=18.41 TRINITY_DN57280_c0_g1_i1:39-395(+)